MAEAEEQALVEQLVAHGQIRAVENQGSPTRPLLPAPPLKTVKRRQRIDPFSVSKIGSDAILVVSGLSVADHAGLKEVDFSSTVHRAFYELEFGNLPSVCPFDHGELIAALTAALSLTTPLAKDESFVPEGDRTLPFN